MPTAPLIIRPALPFIVLRRNTWLAILIALAWFLFPFGLGWLFQHPWLTPRILPLLAAALLLIWNEIVRRCERYTLTQETATWESGVFRRLRVDLPLYRIQNTVLYRSIGERIFAIGTIGAASAATDTYELVWSSVARPDEVLSALRQAADRARPAKNVAVTPSVPGPLPHSPIPVIGLAGGIGSGKSTVAAALAELGCLVIDSDQRSRAALDRPEVSSELVRWWGSAILAPDGRVDRREVSRIVFTDPAERQRLEALVHPIVRQDRAAMIAEAGSAGRRPVAVVIDAPLLFEAGLDRECDAVIFVDSPRSERLARVQASRGWDETELTRRELAQWPLADKQARSTHTLVNDGDRLSLAAAAGKMLDEIAPLSDA